MNSPVKIELLAPARDPEAGRAAVDCGADAVYIGGPGWGARHAAGNSVEDIAALVRYARPFGVRVYVTLNTLLFDHELADAQRIGQQLIDAGVDALIVQDMAWLRMGLTRVDGSGSASNRVPVEFHASTQTSNMRAEDIAFLGRAGFSRVIMERWLTTSEIADIRRALDAQGLQSLELEAFVHGAMCVGFSGRCFLSRAMSLDGGASSSDKFGVKSAIMQRCREICEESLLDVNDRANFEIKEAESCFSRQRSGNRGTCSQPCRLAWDLVAGPDNDGPDDPSTDGETDPDRIPVKGKHLLSVPDIDLSGRLDELLDAGVTSLKIEGRLKDTAYVRNIVSHYNSALNALGICRSSRGRSIPDFTPDPAKSFSRAAFSGGDVSSPNTSKISSFDTPKSVGEPVGRVEKTGCERTGNRWFTLAGPSAKKTDGAPVTNLASGDGICFFASASASSTGGKLRGTSINRVESGRIYPNDIEGITSGTEIFRNYDHTFTRALERSRTKRKIPVAARISTSPDRVEITFRVVDRFDVLSPTPAPPRGGNDDLHCKSISVSRSGVFEPARDPEKMAATARSELAKSGDTIFEVTDIQTNNSLHFVPVSTLAALRREGLTALLRALEELPTRRDPAAEDLSAKFPRTRIEADENVTNRLSERFYRDHDVTEFAPPLELQPRLEGAAVMRTRHCLRRQLGQCPRENSDASENSKPLPRELFLVHGRTRLRLEIDCAKCETTIVKL